VAPYAVANFFATDCFATTLWHFSLDILHLPQHQKSLHHMDLLKTMRKKTGLGQQAMAKQFGVINQLYFITGKGKRILSPSGRLSTP
jgi:hypothetical protein